MNTRCRATNMRTFFNRRYSISESSGHNLGPWKNISRNFTFLISAEGWLRSTLQAGLLYWRQPRRQESRFRWSIRFWRQERSRSYTFWDYGDMEQRRGCWQSVFLQV